MHIKKEKIMGREKIKMQVHNHNIIWDYLLIFFSTCLPSLFSTIISSISSDSSLPKNNIYF